MQTPAPTQEGVERGRRGRRWGVLTGSLTEGTWFFSPGICPDSVGPEVYAIWGPLRKTKNRNKIQYRALGKSSEGPRPVSFSVNTCFPCSLVLGVGAGLFVSVASSHARCARCDQRSASATHATKPWTPDESTKQKSFHKDPLIAPLFSGKLSFSWLLLLLFL